MCFKKKSNFSSNYKGVRVRFYRKRQFAQKTDQNSVFYNYKAEIPNWLHIIIKFAFGFTENQQFTTKLIETPYFLVVKLIFHIGYK
jgi:hypothetical protein